MTDHLPNLDELTPLSIPIPPQLTQALGYRGECRWIATWWESAGDEAIVADHWTQGDGNWYGFLSFVCHDTVAPLLQRYDLGSTETRNL